MKVMDDTEARRLRRKAYLRAHAMGWPLQDALDLAQMAMVKFCSGKHDRSTVGQVVIDCVRDHYGQGRRREFSRHMRYALDEEMLPSAKDWPIEQIEARFDIEKLLGLIDRDADREILTKYFLLGYAPNELQREQGVSESRIYQQINDSIKRLRHKLKFAHRHRMKKGA